MKRVELAGRDRAIQGYSGGVFWERNNIVSSKETEEQMTPMTATLENPPPPRRDDPRGGPDAGGPGGTPAPVVSVRGLTKVFKDFWGRPKARAVDNVDFEVRRGEVFGLLGPNGSGKSTTVKLLLGLLHPTRGHIEVFGHSPRHVGTKSLIGYLPEESYLYRFLDSRETLDFFGNLFDLPPAQRRRRTEELLEMVGLSAVRTRVVGEFSKGMQRRIGLAQALINDPELIILDEPTAGLDPIGCREVKDLILTLAGRGKTVLLSSHLLSDVEDVCDRVVIYYGGRIQAMGTLEGIAGQTRRGLHHHAAGLARNDAEGARPHRARRRRRQGGGGHPDPEPGKLLPGSGAQSQGKLVRNFRRDFRQPCGRLSARRRRSAPGGGSNSGTPHRSSRAQSRRARRAPTPLRALTRPNWRAWPNPPNRAARRARARPARRGPGQSQ